MKPLSFENLRRFMIGGKKKKDRNEPSFKRSDSFKRISIKKNYLERGKKHRQQAVEAAVVAATCTNVEGTVKVTKPTVAPLPVSKCGGPVARAMGGGRPLNSDTLKPPLVNPATSADGPDSMIIGYNQWLKGMKTDDGKTFLSEASSPVDEKPPTPPPRKKNGSLNGSLHSSMDIIKLEHSPGVADRKYHNKTQQSSPTVNKSRDSLISLSPQVSRSSLSPVPSRTDSGLSINLGRVWIDAPLAMAPRSLELPRPLPTPPGTAKEPPRIHHSLDSALKDSSRASRTHHYPTSPTSYYAPVTRTLSSSTTHTNKSRDSSGKDSGFSFSISIPRLTDFPGMAANTAGFFRKKKNLTRPKPSVSRDGYFKRTSGVLRLPDTRTNTVKRNNSRKKRKREKPKIPAHKADIYTVVVNRSNKSFPSLNLDPMIFVPPEKRKPGAAHKKYQVREIRRSSGPHVLPPTNDRDQLYESIPDVNPTPPSTPDPLPPLNNPHASDINYSDTDEDRGIFIPLGVSPVPRRKPVRKKKSTRRNVKYLAKPVHRAQSTLRRSRRAKKSGKPFRSFQ